jgi:uncharacterized LabA/DUF88 family protein
MMRASTALFFVDGENLSIRYQHMLIQGRKPLPEVVHVMDSFVWSPRILDAYMFDLKRISYYTSVVGDDLKVRNLRETISGTSFTCKVGWVTGPRGVRHATKTAQVLPFVRKKVSSSRKESICDIQIAVDVLRACYRNHADELWILTGDGDFLSLFQEVAHTGKTVIVGAFSGGLCADIPYAVDQFICLDQFFFEPDVQTVDHA